MLSIDSYREVFIAFLQEKIQTKAPKSLYAPITYILKIGGKRLRPVLTLMTTEVFGGNHKDALNAALAIEVFHNFSLVHDDIMDDAPLRRGSQTVHEKWNLNTGILSGDAMLIQAYQLFENYENDTFRGLAQIFSKTAIEVCEGQQYDVDFEERNDVSEQEYLKMIEYKTAVLVGAAMKMGALVANASKEDAEKIYDFGRFLGIAFQLQDDYLDAFGNPESFGKQVGGDIIENKKTYLYIKALEFATNNDKEELLKMFSSDSFIEKDEKIKLVKEIFIKSGSSEITNKAIQSYTSKAMSLLDSLSITNDKKQLLKEFGEGLMYRKV
jgi:geranylgeranyl diphosphate synthase, type II